MTPPIANSDTRQELASANIPSIIAEVNAKISGHNKELSSIKTSAVTETLSNLIFFGIAHQLSLPHIEEALIGALLVYVPLAYDTGLNLLRRYNLKSGIEEYKQTHNADAFDKHGATFRGNTKLYEADHHVPFISFHSLIDPIDLSAKNNRGIIGSTIDCIHYTGDVVLVAPVNSVFNYVAQSLGVKKPQPSPEFSYVIDPCSAQTKKVIRARLPHINPMAVAQMPFQLSRLRRSYMHTMLSMPADYLKIPANLVGVYGAVEFCVAVGSDIAPRVSNAFEYNDPSQILVAAGWAATCVIGLGPGKHFMDDCKKVSERLKSKWGIAKLKKSVMREIESVLSTQDQLKRALYDYYQSDMRWSKKDKKSSMERVHGLLSDHPDEAFNSEIRALLRTRGIQVKPPSPAPA